MAGQVRNLSALVETQLPEFIYSEYPLFVKFLQKYYEHLENDGNPLDLIRNFSKYQDLDTYEKKILSETTSLTSPVISSDTVINVSDTSAFPEKNGYILIGEETIFYKEKTATSFVDCYRNISATTKLGDLYHELEFNNVEYNNVGSGFDHTQNSEVVNISNLFLYAFVKNFEKQYLADFPQNSLKPSVDKKTLIKNIKQFYQAKGTDQSIEFIFNSIVAEEADDIPSVYYPKDSTIKSSSGEWVNKYALKVKVLSGDASNLIGSKFIQDLDPQDPSVNYSFAVIDDVINTGDGFQEIVLAPETIVGSFKITNRTKLTKQLNSNASFGNKINVFSTSGWNQSGSLIIGNEKILYNYKNVNQFTIESRGSSPQTHIAGTEVYKNSTVYSTYIDSNGVEQRVEFLIYGVLYDLQIENNQPYSSVNDIIQESKTGFETLDPIIYNNSTSSVRWLINESNIAPISSNASIQNSLQEVIANVSAIFEDDLYYYITSSGFPSHTFGTANWTQDLQEQNHLKLIRKSPAKTTEVYQTTANEVGILVNGVTVRSHKDSEKITYGEIQKIDVTSQGGGYLDPPYVLVEDAALTQVARARAILSGEVVDRIDVLESGSGFFPPVPSVTITSGRGAVVNAIVTSGRVTSLVVVNPGEYYSTPPEIIIRDTEGKGRFARYTSIISNDGKLVGFNKLDEGKFYSQANIVVEVRSIGSGATATSDVRKWTKNAYKKYQSSLDDSFGFYFENNDPALGYGYSYLANPKKLRIAIGDNLSQSEVVPATLTHSPILGYAYDGNPIYGPYGYSNPLDSASAISRMTSSYVLKVSRTGGPSLSDYPLGSFIEDYQYNHRSGSLDENNGRFCITPDYPEGTYAYFITIDVNNDPVYPYILGKNYYSIPVDANYNKKITQLQFPSSVSRLRTTSTPDNGDDTFSIVNSIESGSITNFTVESSHDIFSTGSLVELDYAGTNGSTVEAKVSEIKGKQINSFTATAENSSTKNVIINTVSPCYLFDGDTLTQQNTGASGTIVGNIFNDQTILIKDVSGNLDESNTFTSNTEVLNFILDQSSSYTDGNEIALTNGKQSIIISVSNDRFFVSSNVFAIGEPIIFTNSFSGVVTNRIYYVSEVFATSFRVSETLGGSSISLTNESSPGAVATSEKARGLILENTVDRNTLKIKVLRGQFEVDQTFYLSSGFLGDTRGSKIVTISSLSSGIEILTLRDKIAVVETSENHNVTVGDTVTVDLIPADSQTETTIYVRKRIYQKVKFNKPSFSKIIKDTGIGSIETLNSGADYANGGSNTFTNIELVFADQTKCRDSAGRIVGPISRSVIGKPGDQNNARATIDVTNGLVTSIQITDKGSGYKQGDILTVSASDLNRIGSSTSTAFFRSEVSHVGFSFSNTQLFLNNVSNISEGDLLKISTEILKVTSVNTSDSYVTVERAQEGTRAINHFNDIIVESYKERFRFNSGFRVANGGENGIIISYDENTQEATLVYDLDKTLTTINSLAVGSVFFDDSVPNKLVSVGNNLENSSYKFEFSYDNSIWNRNPVIPVQKYYRYKFDTTSYTLRGSYFELSPSGNFNILTNEVTKSSAAPGNPGSYLSVKFGFGPATSDNTYTEKVPFEYVNYFYYDVNGIIDSERSYLRLVDDPLQGENTAIYVTPTFFAYDTGSLPQYSAYYNSASYTTNSRLAIGEISAISISNKGSGFTSLPTVVGVSVSQKNICRARTIINQEKEQLISVIIDNPGLGYSKPKAVLVNPTGKFAELDIVKNTNGSISGIIVTNPGKGYTSAPEIRIVESDVKIYASSNNIGLLKSTKLVFNGKNFANDPSIKKSYKTPTILVLKNIGASGFFTGEEILQYENSNLIAKAYVTKSGWKDGNNILKVEKIEGQFKQDLQITGSAKGTTATVSSIFVTNLFANIKSYYDNLGSYISDASQIGSARQRLIDSYFYQDYSYVIKSKTPISKWRDLIKNTVHPSGFKVFGEVSIESEGSNNLPQTQPGSSNISFVQLWNPEKNKITVENTYRTITQSTTRLSQPRILRGKGSIFADPFDTGETTALEFYLEPEFDGYFDANGNRAGTKTFSIKLVGSNALYSVSNQYNIISSLDGITQEPGVSFTVTGTQLTFSQAPLGYRDVFGDPISGANFRDGVDTDAQKFVGRIIRFKDNTLNNQYFRKIKNISPQFDGSKTSFDLYYEDDSPVTLSTVENLFVAIDGVVQEPGFTESIPENRGYYIDRSSTPNKIVFVEPPRSFEDNKQTFYATSIGAYEKLEIESKYIDDVRIGPFRIQSAITGKTVSVFEERNALVFVDGVLQNRLSSYEIRGSNIYFNEPLRKGQKVSIYYLYGRDYQKALTVFNFEAKPVLNQFNIYIDGNYSAFLNTLYYYDAQIKSASAEARIIALVYDYINNVSIITVQSQNSQIRDDEDFVITENVDYGTPRTLTVLASAIFSVDPFEENTDGQDLLRRQGPPLVPGVRYRIFRTSGLDIGDLVRVDGESEFREVLSIPNEYIKSNYRNVDDLTRGHHTKVGVTNYDGFSSGEGLDVVANVENGEVVSLTWNKKDWDSYVTKTIYPQPAGYGYENAPQLEFVSQPLRDGGGSIIQPAQGGGATAYLIVHDGEVIDIVLTSGGSEYLTAPKVYVTKGYSLIKRKVSVTYIKYYIESNLTGLRSIVIQTGDRLDSDSPPAVFLTNQLVVTPFDTSRKLTANIYPAVVDSSIPSGVSQPVPEIDSTIEPRFTVDMSSTVLYEVVSVVSAGVDQVNVDTNVTIVNIEKEITTTVRSFTKLPYKQALPSYYDTGAYTTAPLDEFSDIIYINDTSKFTDSGKLLVDDEIVSYDEKLPDRFLEVLRGIDGTTAKSHAAGTFLRQYNENVSIIDVGTGGQINVQSSVGTVVQSTVSTISISVVSEINKEVQSNSVVSTDPVITSILNLDSDVSLIDIASDTASLIITESQTLYITNVESVAVERILEIETQTTITESIVEVTGFYKTGVLDYYVETLFLSSDILQRDGNVVILDQPDIVITRSGSIQVINKITSEEYLESYTLGNLGNRMGQLESWKFMSTGVSVSSMRIVDFDTFYPYYTIEDFDVRKESAISLSGFGWNLGYPSYQTAIVSATSNIDLNTVNVIDVTGNTDNFDDSGLLFIADEVTPSTTFTLVSYTGKTASSFIGCAVIEGSSNITTGNTIIAQYD